MTSQHIQGEGAGQGMRRLLLASAVGTIIEWYDFFLYGLMAPLVFDHLFFPKLDPVTGTIAVYATFAVGFASRPLGGVFFGHFGDRVGRKSMMLVTLLLMGLATAGMGLLPSYQQIGLAAPVLLVLLRFLQGFALGGESTAASLLVVESAGQGKRGQIGAYIQMVGPFAVLLASVSVMLISHLPQEAQLSWGWRAPFLLSAVLVVVGLYIRMNVEESAAFAKQRAQIKLDRAPALEALKHYRKPILVVLLVSIVESTFFYLTGIFSISFITKNLGMSKQVATTAVFAANLLEFIMTPIYGAWSDRIGRKRVFMTGIVLAMVYLGFFFPLLETKSPVVIVLTMAGAVGLIHAFMFSMQTSFYPELFPTRVRFTGVSIGKQFGIVLGGGFAPMIATALLAKNHGNASIIVGYFAVVAVITLAVLLRTKETKDVDITE